MLKVAYWLLIGKNKIADNQVITSYILCPEQDSNLHASQHSHLKRARLPFRHLGFQRFPNEVFLALLPYIRGLRRQSYDFFGNYKWFCVKFLYFCT